MRTITGAGVEPIFGASEYGVATAGLAPSLPWSHVTGAPEVGGTFDIVHETHMPNAIAIHALALAPAPFALPVFNGFLLVDPSTLVLDVGLSDALGASTRSLPIPPDPLLAGFALVSQAVVLALPRQPGHVLDRHARGDSSVSGQPDGPGGRRIVRRMRASARANNGGLERAHGRAILALGAAADPVRSVPGRQRLDGVDRKCEGSALHYQMRMPLTLRKSNPTPL